MPANLPPQYFDVEKQYREAKDPNEKLVYLQQMLSIIPKHKGTEKLQADLKTRISKLKDTIGKQKKSRGSGGAWYQVEKQGAGQIVLVGLPNAGKSTLLNTLTNAHVDVGDYPFTTQLPQVGMLEYEDIKIQIVDTPPLYEEAPPWLYGLYRNGDMLLIVLDGLGKPVDDFKTITEMLDAKNIYFKEHEFGDMKRVIIVLNKIDTAREQTVMQTFKHAYPGQSRVYACASQADQGIPTLRKALFTELNIIRVYTKKVGKPIVKDDPVVLGRGATVLDAAEHIHKDFRKNLKFARLWNDEGYNGQRVEKHHELIDGDVIEFHI
jgi:small GTP-binding protein